MGNLLLEGESIMAKYVQLDETMIDKNNSRMISTYKRYKDYNTIGRNLKEAYGLIDFAINRESYGMQLQESNFNKTSQEIIFRKVSFYYAIILYARWFKATKGNKPKLYSKNYFKGKNRDLNDTHNYIIQLRDKYIVHNEEELLGGEKILVDLEDYKNMKIISCCDEEDLPRKEVLENIMKCIKVVYENIYNEKIPKYEDYLKKEIQEKNLLNLVDE